MKNFRHILSMLLVISICVLLPASALAQGYNGGNEHGEDYHVEITDGPCICGQEHTQTNDLVPIPYGAGAKCGVCGYPMREAMPSWNSWSATGNQRACTQYPFGTDKEMKRTGLVHFSCTYCTYGFDRTITETKWECHGYL